MARTEFTLPCPTAAIIDSLNRQTAYIGFGSHHVAMSLGTSEIASRVASTFGVMLRQTPGKVQAGSVQIAPHPYGICVTGDENSDKEVFSDLTLAVRELFHRTVRQFIQARPDLLWVHGGVAATAGKALLFSAASGQGKSTLVGQLIARGWSYLSDEIAAIDPNTATVLPFPVTPYMRVGGPRDLAPEEVRELDKVQVPVAQHAVSSIAVPLAGTYFLSYHPSTPAVEMTECSPALAVIELMRNSLNPSTSRKEEIAGLCQLTGRVPSRYLRHGSARNAAERIVQTHSA